MHPSSARESFSIFSYLVYSGQEGRCEIPILATPVVRFSPVPFRLFDPWCCAPFSAAPDGRYPTHGRPPLGKGSAASWASWRRTGASFSLLSGSTIIPIRLLSPKSFREIAIPRRAFLAAGGLAAPPQLPGDRAARECRLGEIQRGSTSCVDRAAFYSSAPGKGAVGIWSSPVAAAGPGKTSNLPGRFGHHAQATISLRDTL